MGLLIKEAGQEEHAIVLHMIYEAFKEYKDVLQPGPGALRETVDDIRKKIKDRGGAIIAWSESTPVGCALYYFENNYIYISRVSVIPSERGKGIARQMICYLEDVARRNNVHQSSVGVRWSLPKNIEFYKRLEYEIYTEHRYPEGTDGWYIMTKNL